MRRSQHQAYSDDERMVDRYGVPADTTIFVDKMPPTFREGDLRQLIQEHGGGVEHLVNIWFGTKALGPGESRTSTARFTSIEAAVNCRQLLQHYQGQDWPQPLRVNFVRKKESRGHGDMGSQESPASKRRATGGVIPADAAGWNHFMGGANMGFGPVPDPLALGVGGMGVGVGDPLGMQIAMGQIDPNQFLQLQQQQFAQQQQHFGGANATVMDKHGTLACPTLFLANLPHNATDSTVGVLFPTATGIYCSTKPLAPNERRTSYVSFESTEVAIRERQRVNDTLLSEHQVLDELGVSATERLIVSFSKRGQDKVYSAKEYSQKRREDSEKKVVPEHWCGSSEGVVSGNDNGAIGPMVPVGGNGCCSSSALADRGSTRGGQPCPTLFVSRLHRSANEDTVRNLFPKATKIFCSKKPLREGEDRTSYVTFESTETAISERRRMQGYMYEGSTINITFSTKSQDQEAIPYCGPLDSSAGVSGGGTAASGTGDALQPQCLTPASMYSSSLGDSNHLLQLQQLQILQQQMEQIQQSLPPGWEAQYQQMQQMQQMQAGYGYYGHGLAPPAAVVDGELAESGVQQLHGGST